MTQVAHAPSDEPDLRILAALERAEAPALLAVTLTSVGIIALWTFPALAPFAPAGWQNMPSVTAFGFLLATLSLLLSGPRRRQLAHRVSQAIGIFVMLVPIMVLLSHAGIWHYVPSRWPVLPAPQTAVAFALAAASLPFIRAQSGPQSVIADIGAISALAFVLFLFGGWAFDVAAFVGVNGIDLTSPQTLFCLALLAFVIASRRAATGGIFTILVNIGIGSQMTRKVLPAVLVIPFVVFMTIAYLNDHGVVALAVSRAIAAPLVALATLSVLSWMAMHTNRLERRLRQQSLTDELTGVLNRRGFETVAEYTLLNARRNHSPLVVFYFDLDGLKQVNDTLGHEVGSEMIKAFADVLTATFRKNDVVARVGGDEFIVLAGATSSAAAELLVRLKRNVDAGNAVGGSLFRISYSDGHAILSSGASRSIEDLVTEADAMMYARKVRKRVA